MAQVPDGVLQWLWNAVQGGYQTPQVTYSDAVSALSSYPSLQPRTEVYTYNNGQPALLLCLGGTLPVNFRGTTYRFPLKIWIPQAHPQDPEGIMVFVVPGEAMMIRPGQHVSVDGRVYHPYLRDWSSRQQSSIVEFLRILQDVFAREPPVIAKQPQQQYHQSQSQSPAMRPAPPPKQRPTSVLQQPVEMPAGPNPPPKPPKPGEQARGGTPVQYQREERRDGPPLPPLPHERPRQEYHSPQLRHDGFATPPSQSTHVPGLGANGGPPVSPSSSHGLAATEQSRRYAHAPPMPQSPMAGSSRQQPQLSLQYQQMPSHQQYHQHHQHPQPYPPRQMPSHQQYQQPQAVPKAAAPQPPPDLLTDPFDISIPAHPTQTGPAPPIPPNPEKEHLLQLLSQALVSQAHQKVQQNASALPMLLAQSQAMQSAHQRLQQELQQVEQLDRTLANNEAILRQSTDQCDAMISSTKDMPEPPIDDVLVAPTLVQNQLWNVEAEIAGLKEALWVLQRAVGAGRVGAAEFVKLNRSLGRELFLKMALARKIARGLGLDLGNAGTGVGVGADGRGEGGESYYA